MEWAEGTVNMIKSCKLCLSNQHLCPRCEGPVQLRTITVQGPHSEIVSTSLIICFNPSCQNYCEFKQQTSDSIEVIICDDCKRAMESLRGTANASSIQ